MPLLAITAQARPLIGQERGGVLWPQMTLRLQTRQGITCIMPLARDQLRSRRRNRAPVKTMGWIFAKNSIKLRKILCLGAKSLSLARAPLGDDGYEG